MQKSKSGMTKPEHSDSKVCEALVYKILLILIGCLCRRLDFECHFTKSDRISKIHIAVSTMIDERHLDVVLCWSVFKLDVRDAMSTELRIQ